MLKHLSIRNIVLIEACDIAFDAGLCVLTGETGAGKSILLESLGLALGERAEARLLRAGEAQGSVTAEFELPPQSAVRTWLNEAELPAEDSLILRRTLTADGKTRCFINDAPVSVATLKKIGEGLVEIHGQHDQRGLFEAVTQRTLLDASGGLDVLRREAAGLFAAWQEIALRLAQHEAEIAQALKEEDYLRHMQAELSKLSPEPDDEEKLAQQRALLMRGEKLAHMVEDAEHELEGDRPVAMSLRSAQRILLRTGAGTEELLAPAIAALERAGIELDEALSQLQTLRRASEYDPAKLEKIEERLFALKALARKHQVTVGELAGLLEETQEKLARLATGQKDSAALYRAAAEARAAYLQVAERLSAGRQKAARCLEKALMAELAPLKMERTRFQIGIQPLAEVDWAAHGIDQVTFEAATNAGAPFAPLAKIASGGELSRFMLALKVVLSGGRGEGQSAGASYIFDEIDTGTGGAVADAIGQRLALLGQTHQVLVVTHLPQVAARGTRHFFIAKGEKKGKTITQVTLLSGEARREELARMLAGAEVTREAREAAGKLLEMAG